MATQKQQRLWDFDGPDTVLAEISKVLGSSSTRYRDLDRAAMGMRGWQRPRSQRTTRRVFSRVEASLPPQDPSFPFTMTTGPLLYDRGTLLRCAERLQNLVGDAFVMVHPADARELGLADGDSVSVGSDIGELALTLRLSDEVARGTAFAPLNLSEVPLCELGLGEAAFVRVRIAKNEETGLSTARHSANDVE
jgi:predicted molibdopterin-dependent oxidoreductase YjgC